MKQLHLNLLYEIIEEKSPKVFSSLQQLLDMIERWNKNHHITSVKDRNKIWLRHIVDCLQIVPFVQNQETMLDIGSGFGFPSLPVALTCPAIQITIVEPNLKKNQLCRYVIQELGIKNIEIISKRIENVKNIEVDVVCSRAWGEFKKNTQKVYFFLKENGFFITFRQQKENILLKGYHGVENYSYCLGSDFLEYNIVKVQKKVGFYE